MLLWFIDSIRFGVCLDHCLLSVQAFFYQEKLGLWIQVQGNNPFCSYHIVQISWSGLLLNKRSLTELRRLKIDFGLSWRYDGCLYLRSFTFGRWGFAGLSVLVLFFAGVGIVYPFCVTKRLLLEFVFANYIIYDKLSLTFNDFIRV